MVHGTDVYGGVHVYIQLYLCGLYVLTECTVQGTALLFFPLFLISSFRSNFPSIVSRATLAVWQQLRECDRQMDASSNNSTRSPTPASLPICLPPTDDSASASVSGLHMARGEGGESGREMGSLVRPPP